MNMEKKIDVEVGFSGPDWMFHDSVTSAPFDTPIDSEILRRLNSSLLGWKCPQCGRIYSPWQPTCTMCNYKARGVIYDNNENSEIE